MPVRKRNEFLDDDESDDAAYHTDESERLTKSRTALAERAAKRRKQDVSEESADDSEAHGQDELTADNEDDHPQTIFDEPSDVEPQHLPKATLKSLAKSEKAARKSGVLYISRVPPFMKPHTLKHLLEPHAPKGLGRIFLTPEDRSTYLNRKRAGGNKKKSFTDGWVEFASKTEAKIAAQALNGNIMGGKKGGYYHDDIWNIKYLSGFKWSHLTEQVAAENAEREARMREEIRRTRKENKAFLEDYERGKMLETMDKKRAAKGLPQDADQRTNSRSKARKFEQVKTRPAAEKSSDDAAVQRTLSMIF